MENIESFLPIINITLLNKRQIVEEEAQYVPTHWVTITFEGTILLRSLYLVPIHKQTHTKNVIICRKCIRWAYLLNYCEGRVCHECGKDHNAKNWLETHLYYINCKENHSALDRNDKELIKQKEIRKSMYRNNISTFSHKHHGKRKAFLVNSGGLH